jgi:xanthine dehydrogenase accessory factor
VIEIVAALADILAHGRRAALVTIVRANGSTPQRVGAKMVVEEDGTTRGTIGGGCYENDAVQKARAVIAAGRPQLAHYDLNDDDAGESGLICGGQMDVFIEPVLPPPALYVLGAGHVGQEVARLAARVGFDVHVVDDRSRFASRDLLPEPIEIVVEDIPAWVSGAALPASSFVVVVTRGHRHDLDALRALAGRDLRYVGLIGSRAKVARLFDQLSGEGVAPDALTRVHTPIGLDIGAVTPAEIAVSIVAELIAVRSGKLVADSTGRASATVPSMKLAPERSRP